MYSRLSTFDARLCALDLPVGIGQRRAVEDTPGTRVRDETHWVEAALRGERDAFERLYDRYAAMVHGILLARVPRIDVEDLVQEVFLTVYRRLTTLRDPAAFPGWIAMIARNRATDHLRRAPRTEELSEDLTADDSSEAEAKAILGIIRSLPEAYRETLVLRLVEGMTGPEIAARTGLTHGSVRVNLHRGWRNCARSSTGEKPMDDRYLWDRSGPADPSRAPEKHLGRFRHDRRPSSSRCRGAPGHGPSSRRRGPPRRSRDSPRRALRRAPRWRVESLQGAPFVGSKPLAQSEPLSVGQSIVTDGASRAKLGIRGIAEISVGPNSRVRLLSSRPIEQRLALDRGAISAKIWAPPRLFFIQTSSALAVDLGCAYTLEVDDSGPASCVSRRAG